jgi:hypothetical protein
MRETTSVKELKITNCLVWFTEEHGPEELSAGVGENQTLEALTLRAWDGRSHLIPMLEGLRRHQKIRYLDFSSSDRCLSAERSHALQRLLETSTSLVHLRLNYMQEYTQRCWERITRGIRNSQSLTKLTLSRCYFDKNGTDIFRELFLSGRSQLSTLVLENGVEFYVPTYMVVVSILRERGSSLTALEICGNSIEGRELRNFFSELNQNYSLESLVIERPLDFDTWFSFLRIIPEVQTLRRIRFVVRGTKPPEKMKTRFLEAFKKNDYLEDIDIQAEFLSRKDQALLRSYAERNAAMPGFVLDPMSVSRDRLPIMLEGLWVNNIGEHGRGSGFEAIAPTVAFHSLRSFGEGVGPTQAGVT